MAKALSTLAVGALVKDTGTLYNGKPIIWKIADRNHASYPANSVTLITERIISLKCFDAIESGNSDSNRRSYGNNRWIYSNIRRWLNSQAAAGKWYAAQHSADAPPSNANVWSNYNEYDGEAGFLAGFSANFLAALLNTTHTVGKASVDGGGTETCVDKIFFMSSTEAGLTGDVTCGSKLALFTNDASRQAKPTAECVSKSEYTNSSFNANSFWYYWLCDAYASYSYLVRYVDSSGALSWDGAYYGLRGARPLCNLKSEILVSDNPDSDGAYTIIWNRAPSAPGSISVPTQILSGQSVAVTWGISTDEDGSVSGYILERKTNDGSWTQVYKGINRAYTDTASANWQSVAYRVKAYDNAGADSAYTTSPVRAVTHNTPPAISGANTNLGEKTGAFSQAYTVTDQDSGQIKRGETAVLNRILFGLVTKAEKEFGGGTGKLKLAAVSDWIYQRIPAVLKLLFSEKDIEKLIEDALEEAKKAWGTNGNLAAYIEPPAAVIELTPEEAEEIAAKLNAEPGTIVPGH